jgi:predicted nucleotidyltransferase
MEKTNNKISEKASHFFNNLREQLEVPLYFYGSVQRADYYPEESDIDVAIFTDNVSSMLCKLEGLFNIEKSDFKRFVWRLSLTNKLVNGVKYIYLEPKTNFKCEICVYEEKYKKDLLIEYNDKIRLPFYSIYLLIFLKFLYYKLGIISIEWFRWIKRRIITYVSGKEFDNNFIILDNT